MNGRTDSPLAPGSSSGPLQRAPAGLKLGLALGLVAITALMPARHAWWFVLVTLLLAVTLAIGGVPVRIWARRLLWLAPLVAGTMLLSWFGPAGGPPWWLLAVRSLLCLAIVVLLGATTPPSALLRVLQRLPLPGVLLTTLTLMHRYLFVIRDEAQRMERASLSRSFRPRRLAWAAPAGLVGRLFIRASERAERIYAAMCARGWK